MSKHVKSFVLAMSMLSGSGLFTSIVLAKDAESIHTARISLTQAIATAEKHANGKASESEFKNTSSGGEYEIEVVSGKKVFEVVIDANNGAVVSSKEETRGEEHETDD